MDFITRIGTPLYTMSKDKELLYVHSDIQSCTKCDLSKTRTLAVTGEGPSNATMLFVGEAPGAREDELGRPFVGRSGILLTELLTEAGIERKEVFITSILKSRPPNNRKPTSSEIEACLPYLLKQIEIISPEVIVLLGSVAVSTLIGPWKIGDAHGKTHESADGQRFFITYHPAAALRFQKYRQIMVDDFKKLRLILE